MSSVAPAFLQAFDRIAHSQHHFFITGRAGTGKTSFVRYFSTHTAKKTILLAPTGIAALQLGGQTIHSFFGFPHGPLKPKDLRKRLKAGVYKKIEVIIIDEISMVRADMLDGIDRFLRNNREKKDLPFGGVQLILCGDPFQLPPVVKDGAERTMMEMLYESPYFFSSKIFQQEKFHLIHFTEVFRQKEKLFLQMLEMIRTRTMDEYHLHRINERHFPVWEPPAEWGYITLATTNSLVDQMNMSRLLRLPGESRRYMAASTGEVDINGMPSPAVLELRKGAQVMFVLNDPEKNWVNGTLGRVVNMEENAVLVEIAADGLTKVVEVAAAEWKVMEYDFDEKKKTILEKERGTYTQIPLRLAWAVTIHKSQGMSFDKVQIHLGTGAFAPGQAYVAFSRCRTLEGIVLSRKLFPKDIFLHPAVYDFAERFGLI